MAKAALCVLLMSSAQGHAADRVRAPFVADSGSIALRCGVLVDGISDRARVDQIVVIRDGRIASVQPGSARSAKSLQPIKVLQRVDVVIKGGLVFKIPAEVKQ
jgi:hypothetical protein